MVINVIPESWGPIIVFLGIIFSSIVIDLLTLSAVFIWRAPQRVFTPKKFKRKYVDKYSKKVNYGVTVVIPAYKEEENIYNVIASAFNQTCPPSEVIVIEDNSPDGTLKECLRARQDFKNVRIIAQKKNKGKAYNITYVLKTQKLEELTLILDADTFLSENYIEEIVKPFSDPKVAISTGTSLLFKQKGFFANILFHGADFNFKFFCFRKRAQSFRNAISVVTGDSAVYRTSLLEDVGGLPLGTQTEDMDMTWIALEKKHKIVYQQKALARSKDAATLKGHWKQVTRWFSGSFQCLFRHNKKLFKAKSLLFTTLVPSIIDSFGYSLSFLLMIGIFFVYPPIAIAFFLTDLVLTLIAIIYLTISYSEWKGILYLPHIYIIKFIWSLAFLYAAFKTAFQFIGGKRAWGGTWDRSSFYRKKK